MGRSWLMAQCQPACSEWCTLSPLQVMYRLCTALYPHLDISQLPELIRQGDAEAKQEADAWAEVMVGKVKREEADAAELEVARRRREEAEASREEERRRRVEAEDLVKVLQQQLQQLQQQQQQMAAMGAGLPAGAHP